LPVKSEFFVVPVTNVVDGFAVGREPRPQVVPMPFCQSPDWAAGRRGRPDGEVARSAVTLPPDVRSAPLENYPLAVRREAGRGGVALIVGESIAAAGRNIEDIDVDESGVPVCRKRQQLSVGRPIAYAGSYSRPRIPGMKRKLLRCAANGWDEVDLRGSASV